MAVLPTAGASLSPEIPRMRTALRLSRRGRRDVRVKVSVVKRRRRKVMTKASARWEDEIEVRLRD